jgi:uncharacterized protein (TIGR04255 family)
MICLRSQEVGLAFGPGPGGQQQESTRWDFLTADRQTGVVVNEQMVLVHTNAYETYETFSDLVGAVIDVVATEVGVRITQRLGLRYVDRVTPKPGEAFEEYVAAAMMGFPSQGLGRLGADKAAARTETLLQTGEGTLAVRSVLGPGVFLPPDLVPSPLAYRTVDGTETALVIDFDHFRVKEGPFDLAQVMHRLERLHDALDIAFRQTVTPYALTQWGQELLP